MANLQDEMKRNRVSILDIQVALGCTEKTARNKVNGKSVFTFPEALKIKKMYFPKIGLEQLFGESNETKVS